MGITTELSTVYAIRTGIAGPSVASMIHAAGKTANVKAVLEGLSSISSMLTVYHRICNPPPSVGKVRSCGVTPFLDVRLDDVLDRKHLPPLGLKDFEEYLLYVEQSPENLYFLLWMKEYTTRYHTWAKHTKATLTPATASTVLHTPRQSFRTPPPSDPSLALFYAKAKQTFFIPGAEYELDIPSDILAPFHYSSQSSAFVTRVRGPAWNPQNGHPDPAVFTEVALEVRAMLKESLSRFVYAASTNVGSRRAACGITAGLLCLCFAGILPLALTSDHWRGAPHARWWRLTAFPGIWLGLLVLIASLNGVCMMVYVFGDLRQLRKFELARPAISRPLPAPVVPTLAEQVPRRPEPSKRPNIVISKHSDKQYDPVHFSSTSLRSAPRSLPMQGRPISLSSECTNTESSEASEGSTSSSELREIEVSPAYFDDAPAPEGPATATGLYRSRYHPVQSSVTFPALLHTQERMNPAASLPLLEHRAPDENVRNGQEAKPHSGEDSGCFGPSAAFIRHEVGLETGDLAPNSNGHAAFQKGQSQKECFDFDLLPKLGGVGAAHVNNVRLASNIPSPIVVTGNVPTKTENPAPSNSPPSPATVRQQYKCRRTHPPPLSFISQASSVHSPDSYTPSPTSTSALRPPLSFMVPSFTAGVPAFGAPMTRVHSPVVIRAQWEVVIRSAILALIGAVALIAIFVGVVP
ncbi:hypothetical protein K503DRAFT_858330 [Rhizopogon vinicolor AM-OR11-026]|uniref:RGS domain-containing protein n=1 Tax=Rhizopogon vinicolor AM-OR11-026 TaxID=1314800 RepID=A0A1B7MTK0_9AGAM|nr:hypothetical protein K503DRAFT_858330 [Rhizopogon vinicolor AM-OR11-026]